MVVCIGQLVLFEILIAQCQAEERVRYDVLSGISDEKQQP